MGDKVEKEIPEILLYKVPEIAIIGAVSAVGMVLERSPDLPCLC